MPSNSKDVWGKVVLYLKEHRHVALHVACGDITEVEIENGMLVITSQDNTVLSLLESGKRELERALSWQGLEMGVEVKQKVVVPNVMEEDEKKLRKIFGDRLNVKKE